MKTARFPPFLQGDVDKVWLLWSWCKTCTRGYGEMQDRADSLPVVYIWATSLDSQRITGECGVLERGTKETILCQLLGSRRMVRSCLLGTFTEVLCVARGHSSGGRVCQLTHTECWAWTVAAGSSCGALPGQSLFLLLVSKAWHCWWVAWPKSTARTMLDCPRYSELLHRDGVTVHCSFFLADFVRCKLWDVKKNMWGSFRVN